MNVKKDDLVKCTKPQSSGRILLIVAGALMITFGISSLSMLVDDIPRVIQSDDMFLALLQLVSSLIGVLHLAIGVIGVVCVTRTERRNKPKKTKAYIVCGIIAVIFALVRMMINIEIGLHWNSFEVSLAIGAALSIPPVLFLIGAVKKRIAETKNGEGSKDGQID